MTSLRTRLACGLALLGLLAAAPTSARAQVSFPFEIPNIGGTTNSLTGTFDIERFVAGQGGLQAVGDLTAELTNAAGDVLDSITLPDLAVPVQDLLAEGSGRGRCDILHLELGPLDLNLLGVVVHLDKIVLDIDAEQGPGNLLGNLLCQVAHLLDRPAANLGNIARLLNRILDVLG